ncbi:MAG TPA: substrate-binding domain-containing protein [Spirochaetota bacterium]|nr:substrate-binding domain-containing protein [Spirochaetota bacterium]HNT10203.1 substrate-binding domain-containing protein [Spirochaetota bacterium]
MSSELMNTRELAEYLGIHEKQVYALIKANRLPGTRITGKWIFPKHLIDEWIETHSLEGRVPSAARAPRPFEHLLAAGSNDPVLDLLLHTLKQTHPDLFLFSATTGSTEGLRLLAERNTDIAWCHLNDPADGASRVADITRALNDEKIAIVHLFQRELGLVFRADCPVKKPDFESITEGGLRFINRQPGAGTRLVADHFFKTEGIDTRKVAGYADEVYTHLEVGLAILSGAADIGLATRAISSFMGLRFTPVISESFDMILCQDVFFKKEVQAFIDTLKSAEFRARVEKLGNYDFGGSGKIRYSSTQ